MEPRRSGFTLIELLVVIAIIAILAAILFPVFMQARESAKSSQCLSNLRSLATAMKMYGDDWGGKFANANEWGVYPDLTDCLKKYAKSKKIFVCPSDIGERINGQVGAQPYWKLYHTSYNWPAANTYPLNRWPYLAGLPQDNPIPSDPSQMFGPLWIWRLKLSKRPMMFDGRSWHFATHTPGNWSAVRGWLNLAYCDGHVGKMEYQKLLAYLWGPQDPG